MHPDEEQLERLRHGEFHGDAESAAREHVAACAVCRATVDRAAREEDSVHAALRALDAPASPVAAERIVAAARATSSPSAPRRPARSRLRQAAAVALVLVAAGGAYALPGSPLRAWLGDAVEWAGGRARPQPPTVPPTPIDEFESGIAVAPGRTLVIQFTAPQGEGHVTVRASDGAEVEVRAPAAAAAFTSETHRLTIDNAGSAASFEIAVPRSAPRVEIRVGERRLYLKEGSRIDAPTAGADGTRILSLAP